LVFKVDWGMGRKAMGLPTVCETIIIPQDYRHLYHFRANGTMNVENPNQLDSPIDRRAMKILKEREKLIAILFVFFFIIGMILFVFTMYYSVTLVVNASATEPPDFSSLNIIRIIGGILVGISFFLLLFWAHLRDKRKKMNVH
jgi:choline-glycine betaine transporter